ncbi:Hpt domain-containing protein [Uliginosibacterium sp. TH139]|uniref:hybrid sensor histidine kinase/response regulator n=1 Tax=Uliginosibacterium sp. TH139 TaxID=2067453 RepID=UPI000C7ABD39|nr:Hpt domain-containing protein [Uliginosibacterium sp. TH139]PLK49353.1 hybrid sensor histidine kinase/response regulator [Uliginosibacterium sp. TH139]
MSQKNEFDVGPLTWVKGEIDAALSAARERLAEVQADPAQREPLRFAQSHVHQASGALSIVGLDGVSQFAEAIDKLLSALAAGELVVSSDLLALAMRSVGMLGNYINEISAGAPHQPLRLFPAYQELVSARGGEAPQPSELFFPDLSVRPQLASTESLAPERAAHELRVLRGRFEKGLLTWLRKPQDKAGPMEMLTAVHRIEQIQSLPATRAFWWASIAFFEGLALQAIPADRPAQRLCRRIDTQMRRLLEGSQIVAERLVRDVLYFVATAGFDSEHAQAVRHTYGLDRALPASDVELSDTLRQPYVLRVREVLEQAKESWNRFCAGAAVALPQFQEQLGELVSRVEPMRLAQVDRLLTALREAIEWLRADPLRLSDDLSMEVATSLLVVEQACESPNADPALLRKQVDLLCTQFTARVRGDLVMELDLAPFGEASRRAQERLFFNQLAREILTNLGQIEQTLDSFFRSPEQRDSLASLAAPLKQIEGAFAVLGEMQAVELVRNNAAAISALGAQDEPPAQDECDTIAHQLSALGFYVESLKNGPAKLESFLNPGSARVDEELVAAADATVEAQLQRETRETQNLVEALKEAPEDAFLREQLVSSLEAIREDAQLVADSGLEQKAKDALASLKSGDATQEQLAEALAGVSPAASPQHSEETARLLEASDQEVDAELLAIFLEEAVEVLATIAEHRNKVVSEAHDFDALTTVRRGFHTLKGSSRMVGLNDFSDAARYIEMAMNRWLQLEKDADARLVSLLDHGCLTFGAWVEQLEAGGSLHRDATALIAEAQALLASLDVPADEQAPVVSVAAAAPALAEANAEPESIDLDLEVPALGALTEEPAILEDAPEEAPAAGASELDLTSTLLELDLASISSGERHDTVVDLAVTDFEGDALRAFTEEFGSEAGDAAAQEQLGRFEAQPIAAATAELDLEFDDLDSDDSALELPVLEAAEAEAEESAQHLELDLTASMTTPDLESLIEAGNEPQTVLDLSVTDFAGESLLATLEMGEETAEVAAPNTPEIELDIDIDLPVIDEQGAELDAASADEGPTTEIEVKLPSETAELAAPELDVVAELPVLEGAGAAATAEAGEEPLEEIAIDDGDDGIDLPELNFGALSVPEPVAASSIDPLEGLSGDEVSIGDQTLSRGLYDLYIAEARQLLDNLLDEHTRLSNNPLRVPTIDAIRAAHTLAGISGTARIEPAYALGKALEHALHRFTDVEVPPEAGQTDVFGTAILTLDGMLAEVVHHVMPVEAPDLIEQLKALHPALLDAPKPDLVVAPVVVEPIVEALAEEVPEAPAEIQIAAALPVAPTPEEAAAGPQDDLDDQLLPIFFEEADELSDAMAAVLREMRANPADTAPQQALARHLHTIKGSSRMAGAMRLGQYIHNLESHLESALHNGQTGSALVDDLENGLDHISAMIEALKNPQAPVVTDEDVSNAEAELELISAPPSASVTEVPAEPAKPQAGLAQPAAPRAAQQPLPTQVFDELEASQTQQRAPLRVRADMIDRFVNEAGEVSIARTRIEGELRSLRRSLLDLTENVIRLRNQLREVEIQAESQMQSRIAAAESTHANFDPLEFDRFTRLQELTRFMAESVGDVTTIQQNLLRNLDAADAALHAQGRLSRDLQQALMSVRMVPFEELADRLYRVVRQTSKELGKRANLDIQGGSIEIDRGVLDRMTAPIEHLLRNAIAHGIETPEQRAAAGKPEFGQITLKLTQLSNEIALELADDGHGLDYARILARGRAAGLVGADEQPNENRLTQLIFEPGFSTAETVSGVAGRGVGMDVVKNETLSVGGRIEIFSDAGQGSRFLIHLPLTLAVTQALLVRSGERTYAIPSNMVEQALELKEAALNEVRTKGVVEWKDTQYSFTYLPRLLGNLHAHPQPGRYHWVLLVRAGSQTLAVHIDELRGNQEIVVKNAGPQFVRLLGYSGATVLADGEISLIINPVALAARQSVPAEVLAESAEAFEAGYQEPAETRIPSIMVVDDSLTVRKITSRMLEREGFQVVTAKDGVDALEQLVEYKPDVMLLDIEMPRMDGFDLARNVRADARLKDVPIIMITSRMADKHRNYAMEIGVNNYLGKPFQEEQLLELITGFIAAQRG